MPKKPTKWGIKVWVCADAKTAYITTFSIYTGKTNDIGKGLAYRVVMNLLQDYLGKHYKVYFDNFYTSPTLVADLRSNRIYSSGTCRTNRKHFPEDIGSKLKNHDSGTIIFRLCGDITIPITTVRYTDKRDVWCLSTICGTGTKVINRRIKGGDGGTELVTCPNITIDYNQYMGGVDVVDQHFVYYAIGRKGLKWWRRVFYRLMEMAIVNAYSIHKLNNPGNVLSHKSFRLELAQALCSPLLAIQADLRGRRPTPGFTRLVGKHFPYWTTERSRCLVCAKQLKVNGKPRDTRVRTHCRKCNVHLCVGECFEAFHTRVKY